MERQYVDNNVFKFYVGLKWDLASLERTIYTRPDVTDEDLVEDKYFTPERIKELKKELIKRIKNDEDPFVIQCVDTDGGYNVTEEQIFEV